MIQNTIDFQKKRLFQEFFSDTYLFLQSHWKSYYTLIAMYAAPFVALGAYYSSLAQLKIIETENLMAFPELLFALVFDLLGQVMINGISFAYIVSYISKHDTSRETVTNFFNQHIVLVIWATLFSSLLLYLGFIMFIVPGIILLPALSMFVFDKLLNKQAIDISFTRCLRLSQSDFKMSYGVVLVLFVGIFIAKQIVGSFISIQSSNFIAVNIVVTTVLEVFFSFASIIIVMLYYSLFHNQTK